jgi:hypothetical protein
MRKSKFNQDGALAELNLAINGGNVDGQIDANYTAYVTFNIWQGSNNSANIGVTVNDDEWRLTA